MSNPSESSAAIEQTRTGESGHGETAFAGTSSELLVAIGEEEANAPGLTATDVPGYDLYPGRDLVTEGDFVCEGTQWPGGCQVMKRTCFAPFCSRRTPAMTNNNHLPCPYLVQIDGNVQEIGSLCDAMPVCVGFVALPKGFGKRPVPTAFLKSDGRRGTNGTSQDDAWGPEDFVSNNFAAVYIRQQGASREGTTRPDLVLTSSSSPPPHLPRTYRVEGYTVLDGQVWIDKYDYVCRGSEEDGACVLTGSVQQIGTLCALDDRCDAFSFIPEEEETETSANPVDPHGKGILKTGPLNTTILEEDPR